MQCVENCADPNPRNHVLYEQPVWQTLQMFVGEMLCFLPIIYAIAAARYRAYSASKQIALPEDENANGNGATATATDVNEGEVTADGAKTIPLHGKAIFLMWIPAFCDLTATTLMNVGLLYTPVSIYQMTRGALVLFVGIFSVLFLKRRLWLYQWVSLLIVMTGVGLVGWSGSLVKEAVKTEFVRRVFNITTESEEAEVGKVLVGIFFILFAQIFTATQFVVEEKIMSRFSVSPLMAVGWEGLFGTISILLFVPILAIPSISSISPFFDLPRGWTQMITTPSVLYSGIAICCSISLFNFFGLSVTRHVSATARSLTDTCRTLSIWIISLGLGWERLVWPVSLLQVLGFTFLVYGTFLFNDLVKPLPFLPGPPPAASTLSVDEERQVLLDETAALPADLGQSGFDVVPEGQHIASANAVQRKKSAASARRD
jgi:drug/metabolite transporter (DMT)-like permease